MLGPGLALRGSDGANSMHKAVSSMRFESKHCFTFFMLQLFFFHISSFLLMWVLYNRKVAIIINCILTVFLLAFIKNGYDIYDNLAVADKEAVTGVFQNFEKYEGMGDLADNDIGLRGDTDGRSAHSRAAAGGNRLDHLQLG